MLQNPKSLKQQKKYTHQKLRRKNTSNGSSSWAQIYKGKLCIDIQWKLCFKENPDRFSNGIHNLKNVLQSIEQKISG